MNPNLLFTRHQAVLLGVCVAVGGLVGPLSDRLASGQPVPPLVALGLLLAGVKLASGGILAYFLPAPTNTKAAGTDVAPAKGDHP